MMHDTLSTSPAEAYTAQDLLAPTDGFAPRHLGSSPAEVAQMLKLCGYTSLDELIAATVPASIRSEKPLHLPSAKGEHAALAELREIAAGNQVARNYLGQGYAETITPPVIQRNILENPGW